MRNTNNVTAYLVGRTGGISGTDQTRLIDTDEEITTLVEAYKVAAYTTWITVQPVEVDDAGNRRNVGTVRTYLVAGRGGAVTEGAPQPRMAPRW